MRTKLKGVHYNMACNEHNATWVLTGHSHLPESPLSVCLYLSFQVPTLFIRNYNLFWLVSLSLFPSMGTTQHTTTTTNTMPPLHISTLVYYCICISLLQHFPVPPSSYYLYEILIISFDLASLQSANRFFLAFSFLHLSCFCITPFFYFLSNSSSWFVLDLICSTLLFLWSIGNKA